MPARNDRTLVLLIPGSPGVWYRDPRDPTMTSMAPHPVPLDAPGGSPGRTEPPPSSVPARSPSPSSDPVDPAGPRAAPDRPARGLVSLLLAAFTATYTIGAVNVALLRIGTDLDLSSGQQGLVLSAYTTMLAAVLICAARAGDRFGRRRLFVLGTTVFALASVVAGLADSGPVLIAVRALQGIAMGTLSPQILSTIQTTQTTSWKARSVALFATCSGLGMVIGQIAGGLLVSADIGGLGWRPAVWSSGLLAVLVLATAARIPPTRSTAPLTLDASGSLRLAAALVLIVYPLTVGSGTGWSPVLAALLVLGLAVAAGFWRRQRRLERQGLTPLVPPSLLRLPALRLGLLMNLLYFVGFGAFVYEFAALTQRGLGYDGLESGLAFAPFAVVFALASSLLGRLSALFGRRTMTIGASVQLLSLVAVGTLVAVQGDELDMPLAQVPLVVLGFSQALMFGPLIKTVMGQVPSEAAGLSGGLFGTVQQLGFSLGVALLGGLFVAVSHGGAGVTGAFAVTIGVQAAVAGVFVLLSLRLTRAGRASELSGDGLARPRPS